MSAQVVHAAGESGPASPGTYAIVLAVPDEEQLQQWGTALANNGPPFITISENGGPYKGQLMAIGVRPDRRSKLKRYFSSLPLLK